jgi:hypothetical protein
MENNFTNLLEHKLISPINDIKSIVIGQKELINNQSLSGTNFETLHLMLLGAPGTQAVIQFKDGFSTEVMIGNTMIYNAPVQDGNPIVSVSLIGQGPLTVQYDSSS